MTRLVSTGAAVLAALLPFASGAHGPVPRVPEAGTATARLFTSDSATGQVIVVDIPGGEIVARLATPPNIILLALSTDARHVVAMRGRNTDRDTITFIDSGFDGAQVRFPTIVRTLAGNAPGGEHEGRLFAVGGRDAIFQEGSARIDILEPGSYSPMAQMKLAAPDHYHYLEVGKYLYVGHLARGFVQIIDRDTGSEVGRIGNCPVLHGAAEDPESGRLFFGCINGVLVVGTKGAELNQEVARIPYPSTQRVATFMKGKGRILWGKTEGAIPALQRLDPGKKSYAFESVPVDDSIQQATTADGGRLLIYSRNGNLDVRDGGTGAVQHRFPISAAFAADYHEHVDKALLPSIVSAGDRAWISIPPEGVIVEADLAAGKVVRRITTGGQPTRLVLVQPQVPVVSAQP